MWLYRWVEKRQTSKEKMLMKMWFSKLMKIQHMKEKKSVWNNNVKMRENNNKCEIMSLIHDYILKKE